MIEETMEIAKRNKKYNRNLAETVLNQDSGLVEAKATKESRRLYNMANQVKCDAHRLNGFTRLDVSKHGILHAEVKAEHEVEDMVVKHFVRRFPNFLIVIASEKGCFIGHKDMKDIIVVKRPLKQVIKDMEDILPINHTLKEFEEFDANLWETFYDSQYLTERKNLGLFLKHIPKKFHDMNGLSVESYKFTGSRKLAEFV